MKPRPLTDLDVKVLRGAQAGKLRRSTDIGDLYSSYLDAMGRSTKVNRQVEKLSDRGLIEIGERGRWSRPWLLTDAGRAELAKCDATTPLPTNG